MVIEEADLVLSQCSSSLSLINLRLRKRTAMHSGCATSKMDKAGNWDEVNFVEKMDSVRASPVYHFSDGSPKTTNSSIGKPLSIECFA